jgi:glycosyltransferase involved in cell wall biosynthesis
MPEVIEYSVVVPVYNCEASILELHERITHTMEGLGNDYEIIFVDDCSEDGSWTVLKEFRKKDRRVKIIRLARNFGQHNATFCGLSHTRGSFIITLDDDLQHPPEEIPRLIEKLSEGYSVVYARYKEKRHHATENLFSQFFQVLIQRILELPPGIFISSFSAMKQEVVAHLTTTKSHYIFLPALVARTVPASRIANADVRHDERKFGRSNYTPFRYFRYALSLLINHSALPLMGVAVLGILVSILSFIYGISIIARKLLDPSYGLVGWNSLMVTVTFIGGLLLMSTGIVGEYLRRILIEISYSEPYIIGEKDV